MPPTFLIFVFVVVVLPVLLVVGIIFALCYGVYRLLRRTERRTTGGQSEANSQ